jgi:RHS repeat-associated protein
VTKISPESTNNGVISGTLTDDGATDGVISGTLTDETDNGQDGVISGTLTDETDAETTTTTSGGTATECAKKKTELTWNEENRLVQSNVGGEITKYLYNAGGERTVKHSNKNETIYVDTFFQTQDTVTGEKYIVTKHIFVGDTRIVSKLSHYYGSTDDNKDIAFEQHNQYYYHPDHLGSTTFVSDYQGKEYQHTEYAPYGESWVDEESDQMGYIKYLYTSKELDSETGFYYFGMRYLEPQTSRWMSTDPIFDGVNEGLSIYGYCYNNPIIYSDPTGLLTQSQIDALPDETRKNKPKEWPSWDKIKEFGLTIYHDAGGNITGSSGWYKADDPKGEILGITNSATNYLSAGAGGFEGGFLLRQRFLKDQLGMPVRLERWKINDGLCGESSINAVVNGRLSNISKFGKFSSRAKLVGKGLFWLGIGIGVADSINEGVTYKSLTRFGLRFARNAISFGVGFGVGTIIGVTTGWTGVGIIGAAVGGTAAGIGADYLAGLGEDYLIKKFGL